jgi:tetratricopeptide (TPR) repeat protein
MQDEMIAEIDPTTPEDDLPHAAPQAEEDAIAAESASSFDDEAIAEDEEIPSWLREMIAADEKQQNQFWSQPKKEGYSDETTQPVTVKQVDESEPLADEFEVDQELPVSEEITLEVAEVEDEPEYPATSIEDVPAGPPARPAVMPTANWSRLADLPEPVEEPEDLTPDDTDTDADDDEAPIFEAFNDVTETEEAPEAEPQAEVVEEEEVREVEVESFSPDTYAKQFEGTGFKPIEFEPAKPEPKEEPEFGEESLPSEAFEVPSPVGNLKPSPNEPTFTYRESEAEEPDLAPSSLAQAKQLLDQGEVNQALPIIKFHINRTEDLGEIKEWLLAANDNIKKNKAEIWEALGDIASLEGDFSTALSAYAKAIDYLELARKNIG